MFLNADPVVQSVLIGLVFASIVTWTVWLAKTIEILFGKRRVRATLNKLAHVRSTTEGIRRLADAQGEVSAARSACRRVASKSGFTTASEIVRNFTTHDLVADDLGRSQTIWFVINGFF
jgi:biopolymer transport protein ExbB/TolQ